MKRFKLLLSLLFLVVFITSCSFSIKVTKEEEKKETKEVFSSLILIVPDVSGMTREDAEEVLVLNGFEVEDVKFINDDHYEENLVVETIPKAGMEVEKDTSVVLCVSTTTSYEVEDFTGKNYLEIKTKLEDLGINVLIEEKDSLIKVDNGIIHSQSVNTGEKLNKGDTITLYIPISKVVYPDFTNTNYSLKELEDFASNYDLNLIINYEKNVDYENGKIINQSKRAGSVIYSGSELIITIVKN